MRQGTSLASVRRSAVIAAALALGLGGSAIARAAGGAAGLDANDLLEGPFPTSMDVAESAYHGSVDNILFCVGTQWCDEAGRSTTIPAPLRVSMNGAERDEYILLVSGVGQDEDGAYGFSNATVRVMLPLNWNGRVFYFAHGGSGDLAAVWALQSTFIEAEYLVDQGWAVVTSQQYSVVPKQRNIHAPDDSYWTQYADYWNGVDGSVDNMGNSHNLPAQRSIAGVVKNLITHHFGREPAVTICSGHSAPGWWITPMMMGREVVNLAGHAVRSGGNYNIPYDPFSGLVFDGFLGFALTSPNSWQGLGPWWDAQFNAEPDPEFPITAPFVMLAGEYDASELSQGGLVFPVYAHRALQARDESGAYIADPALSRDLNDWFRIYHVAGENHINPGFDIAGRFNGGDWYYDPETGANTDGSGMRLTWINANGLEYLGGWEAFNWPYWVAGPRKPLDAPLYTQALFNLADYIEYGRPMPPSHIDQDYLDKATVPWATVKDRVYPVDFWDSDPDLDGLLEDSVSPGDWVDMYQAYPMHVEALAYLTDPDNGFEYEAGSLVMPNYAARVGIYVSDWQLQLLRPFTEDELLEWYPSHGAYVSEFAQARAALIGMGLYDPVLSNDQVREAAHSPIPVPRDKGKK